MNTLICPTCSCSLVRLGISKATASNHLYNDEEYYFCCQPCVDLFVSDPQKYLQEINDLIVCPTCLGEKPLHLTVKLEYEGKKIYFCRCPHCKGEFEKNPEYYLKQLEGNLSNIGVVGHTGGSIKPKD